jgi:hypothetical protein
MNLALAALNSTAQFIQTNPMIFAGLLIASTFLTAALNSALKGGR